MNGESTSDRGRLKNRTEQSRMRSAVQRQQSPERPILRQISSLIYPEIQRRQVMTKVLHPSCARPPRWPPPVLWRRFEDGLDNVCTTNPQRIEVTEFEHYIEQHSAGAWLPASPKRRELLRKFTPARYTGINRRTTTRYIAGFSGRSPQGCGTEVI